MSLIFYYAPMSTATISSLVLEELGLPCEKVRVHFKKGDTKTPEFLKLNPNGKVPLLVHDGTPIWESAAITMYLGDVFGVEKKLYPAPGPKRGEAMKWIAWGNVTLGAAVARFTRNTMDWVPAEERNEKAGEAGKKEIHNCLRILDESLEGRPFLLGEYTLADTHVSSFTDWLRYMKIDLGPYARVSAWNQICSARPAYARVMSAESS